MFLLPGVVYETRLSWVPTIVFATDSLTVCQGETP